MDKHITIFYEEADYYVKEWEKKFEHGLKLKEYNKEKVNAIYRISFPYVIEETDVKQYLFYTAETQTFVKEHFNKSLKEIARLVKLNKLVLITPSIQSAKAFTDNDIPVEIIPHGFDEDVYYIKENKEVNEVKTFLHVSSFCGNKNLNLIIYSFINYNLHFNNNSKLVLKGNKIYDPLTKFYNIMKELYEKKLITIEQQMKTKDKIEVIVDDYNNEEMNDLYNSADVYIDGGVYEAFSMCVIEASACGLPVICNKDAPLQDTTNFHFEDTNQLINLMKQDLKHKELDEKYNYKNIAKSLLDLFYKV